MSLATISSPIALSQPSSVSVRVDDCTVDGNLIFSGTGGTSGSLVTNSIQSQPGHDLSISTATPGPANHVDITDLALSGSAVTTSSALVLDASGIVTSVNLTNGQLLVGSTGATPVAHTLTAGQGILINNGPGTIGLSRLQLVYNTATSTTIVADSVVSLIDFTASTSIFDPSGFFVSSSSIRIPAGDAGIYQVQGSLRWNDAVGGIRGLILFVNSVATQLQQFTSATAAGNATNFISWNMFLSVNDLVQLRAEQTSGAPLGIQFIDISLVRVS